MKTHYEIIGKAKGLTIDDAFLVDDLIKAGDDFTIYSESRDQTYLFMKSELRPNIYGFYFISTFGRTYKTIRADKVYITGDTLDLDSVIFDIIEE